MKRLITRHKNCGGFILPDIENSFTGMNYGYCPKCGKYSLTFDDYELSNELDITLYTIHNKDTNEYLMINTDGDLFIITFESKEQAIEFAKKYEIDNYEIKPNVALYCDDAAVTNGGMIIEKGE